MEPKVVPGLAWTPTDLDPFNMAFILWIWLSNFGLDDSCDDWIASEGQPSAVTGPPQPCSQSACQSAYFTKIIHEYYGFDTFRLPLNLGL